MLSKRLKEKYPEEMTVVLQHRFWDLIVTEERFEVKLTFDGIPERLVVPFAAIKVFFDPSVPYGLQFEEADGDGAAGLQIGSPARRMRPAASRPSRPQLRRLVAPRRSRVLLAVRRRTVAHTAKRAPSARSPPRRQPAKLPPCKSTEPAPRRRSQGRQHRRLPQEVTPRILVSAADGPA